VIDQMCGRFSCFTMDLPGLGQTPSESYGTDYLARLSDRIEAIRVENNIPQWHVVGHDGGSAVAAQYAHSFPQSVSRVALLSPALFPDLKPYFLLELLRSPIVGECLAPLIHPLFWKVVMRRAGRNEEGTRSAMPDFGGPFSGFYGSWRFMKVLRWGRPRDVLAHFPDILPYLSAPTLILHGLRDPAIRLPFARRAQSLIPNSQLVSIDCGHFIPLNRPGFVAKQLSDFLGQSDTSASVSRDKYCIQSQTPPAKRVAR
jgi:pimeloyl-ACP methyl ester carboxylesterase